MILSNYGLSCSTEVHAFDLNEDTLAARKSWPALNYYLDATRSYKIHLEG